MIFLLFLLEATIYSIREAMSDTTYSSMVIKMSIKSSAFCFFILLTLRDKMTIKTVLKRNGDIVSYDANKIKIAIAKANKEVKHNERVSDTYIEQIITELEQLPKEQLSIEDIQDFVELKLMESGKYELAKKYIIYRYKRALIRRANTTDESILSLVKTTNKEV